MPSRPTNRKLGFVPALERLIYVSLLLSGDVAATEPTAADTALEVAGLLEVGDVLTLRRDRLSSTIWRRDSEGLRREVAFIPAQGRVLDVVPIEVTRLEGNFRVVAERGEWGLQIEITDDGTITSFDVSEFHPLVQSPPLALPVRGEWRVVQGGDAVALNRHANQRSGRRALDLAVVDREGEYHRGQGLENRDYYAHGEPIHAMAAGRVVMVVDGVPEHPPGERDGAYRYGNVVIIQHRADLYSIHGHLRPGSAKVRAGDVVESGRVLAECGNSGYSRLPHLYVHLQDGPEIDEAWGIEPVFADIVVERDGVRARMTNVSLVKGDLVSSNF
jgi:hypothetical protein